MTALWTPQPGPQSNAIAADWCPILFYGGGKFSGKTDFLLGDYLQDLPRYRGHWQGIIFRRALTEFTEMQLRAKMIFPKIGGEFKAQKNEWHFPDFCAEDEKQLPRNQRHNYAILRFKYLENLSDIRLYEGHSYPFIGIDELGDWEDQAAFFRLFTFNRYGRFPIPNKRLRATGNPGGRGHLWIKKYFVDPAPLGSRLLWDPVLECNYMFILGTYRDNQIGMQNDPGYDKKMNRAGSPALVRALKEGDFSVVAGAFFAEFDSRHVIPPFQIPNYWTRFMSMDWGACGEGDPFSLGWWAVSDGNDMGGSIPYYPRGTRIRYREWYGTGLPRVSVKEVADGIKERELPDERIEYRTAGGDIRKKLDKSGPSIFEMFSEEGINFHRADQNRAAGWLQMREELKSPVGVRVFSTCLDSIEVIPSVQHSMKNPSDIEESKNDHIPDEWRYALMSRPYETEKPPEQKSVAELSEELDQAFREPTMSEMWEWYEEQRRGRE